MDDIVLLFKRAIKGLDSVLAQERDFTNKVIEKLQDDYKKAWEAYFAKFKINPTREFRLEIINNVNMWLNGSNADAVDPMMQRDQ
jgi:lipopolysaccharide biosynthesis regulator YciM